MPVTRSPQRQPASRSPEDEDMAPTLPAAGAAPGNPTKKPRVSFAGTVSSKTFDIGCHDPKKLGSEEQRRLSPLHAQSPSCEELAVGPGDQDDVGLHPGATGEARTPVRRMAAAADSDSEGSPQMAGEHTEDVTGHVMSLSGLVRQDELEAGDKDLRAPAPITPRDRAAASAATPAQSPPSASEASPLPAQWDLFRQFKEGGGKGPGADEAAPAAKQRTADSSVDAGDARDSSPASPERRSGGGHAGRQSPPDTVDMRGFVSALDGALEGRGCNASFAILDDQSEVPEGRKSFATQLPKYEGNPMPQLRRLPTPSRSPERAHASGEVASVREVVGRSGQMAREALQQDASATRAHAPHGAAASEVAHVLLQQSSAIPDAFTRVPELPKFGQAAAANLDQGAESQLLRGESHLMYPEPHEFRDPFEAKGTRKDVAPVVQGPLHWDRFLSLCGISFPTEEVAPEPSEEVSEADAGLAGGCCPQVGRLSAAHARRVAERLRRAARELGDSQQVAQQEYMAAVSRWGRSHVLPASAADLVAAQEDKRQSEALRARVKGWQAVTKDQAWLGWYDMKRGWLQDELSLAKEHTKALQGELGSLNDLCHRLEDTKRTVSAAAQQQRGRSDLVRGTKRLQELEEQEIRAAGQERDFMRQKVPEAHEALDSERAAVEDLVRRLEEARQTASQERTAARQARSELLRERSRRVVLQQQRYIRTCLVSSATASKIDLSLRAGARASIMQVSAEGSGATVRVLLDFPAKQRKENRRLRRQLFEHAWQTVLEGVESQATCGRTQASLDVVVPAPEVARLLRRMDEAAVRIADQMRALSELSRERPEASKVAAQMEGGKLVLSVTLLVAHSHAVRCGSAGVVELESSSRLPSGATFVDATECIIEFAVDPDGFPDVPNYSDITARQVFGRAGASEAAARQLRGCAAKAEGNGSLANFLHAAVEAMRL